MGLFSSETPKIFRKKEEIEEALKRIHSLDYKERPQVLGSLIRELDNGGVTREELRETIREMRKQGVISDIDERELLKLSEHRE